MTAQLTPDLAYAAGWDEGNRSMRQAGRTVWNAEDYNACVCKYNELMELLFPAGHPLQWRTNI